MSLLAASSIENTLILGKAEIFDTASSSSVTKNLINIYNLIYFLFYYIFSNLINLNIIN